MGTQTLFIRAKNGKYTRQSKLYYYLLKVGFDGVQIRRDLLYPNELEK